eukprot:gene11882-15995_t
MAIPFFMLTGELMNRAGITVRIVRFAQTMVGHMRGGLAQVNVVDSMMFAGISGSAVADVSALGAMLIPAMEKEGYTRRFAAGITAASAIIGPIIPPSGIMIIYAYVMGESVAALFLAGIVPGILIGISLIKVGITDLGGGFNAADFGAPINLALGLFVVLTIILLNRSNTPWVRLSAIIIGLALGSLAAWFSGKL